MTKKELIVSSAKKIDCLIGNLKVLMNDDYNYTRDIQDLTDLLEDLDCRYKHYVESDEVK